MSASIAERIREVADGCRKVAGPGFMPWIASEYEWIQIASARFEGLRAAERALRALAAELEEKAEEMRKYIQLPQGEHYVNIGEWADALAPAPADAPDPGIGRSG
jgi:hypothetical protein